MPAIFSCFMKPIWLGSTAIFSNKNPSLSGIVSLYTWLPHPVWKLHIDTTAWELMEYRQKCNPCVWKHILHLPYAWTLTYIAQLWWMVFRADFRLAPSKWETSLQSSAVSHWLGASLESALIFTTIISVLRIVIWAIVHIGGKVK